jgi:hypothetical protein
MNERAAIDRMTARTVFRILGLAYEAGQAAHNGISWPLRTNEGNVGVARDDVARVDDEFCLRV